MMRALAIVLASALLLLEDGAAETVHRRRLVDPAAAREAAAREASGSQEPVKPAVEGDAEAVKPAPPAEPVEAGILENSADAQAVGGGLGSQIPFVSGLADSVEAKLGVGSGAAQVLAWLAVLSGGYVALQLLMPLSGGLMKKKRQLGQSLLIIGQCGAGKTALFFQLREKKEVTTVSSLKPLRDKFLIEPAEDGEPFGPIEVVDYPGHNRFRGKSADLIPEARCIVYLVDSEDKQRLKDVAEHLYVLFTNRDVCELHTPIVLALNKSDLPSARTEKFIVEEIEREIEHMRYSRSVTLEGEDQADSYLGVDGEKFRLVDHAPCSVDICRISVKKAQLGPLYDLLRPQFP